MIESYWIETVLLLYSVLIGRETQDWECFICTVKSNFFTLLFSISGGFLSIWTKPAETNNKSCCPTIWRKLRPPPRTIRLCICDIFLQKTKTNWFQPLLEDFLLVKNYIDHLDRGPLLLASRRGENYKWSQCMYCVLMATQWDFKNHLGILLHNNSTVLSYFISVTSVIS